MSNLQLTAFIICLALASPAHAQKDAEYPGTQHKQWKTYFAQVAASYKMEKDGDSDADAGTETRTSFRVTPEPVHSYYNSGDAEYNHGAFFFWTVDGRPEAIGQLWCYGLLSGGNTNVVHEMHSLSNEPFQASLPDRQNFWTPRTAGLKLETLSDGIVAPKSTRAVRLAQMRSIAREFSGFVYRSTGKEELRMHQQPLFRYEENKDRKGIVDGAVFAFFSDWDPEVILVLEAHEHDGELTWRYSGARLCNVPVSLAREKVEIWKVDEAPFVSGRVNRPNDPYYAMHGVAFVDPTSLPDTNDN
jgi:hypothetical protein